MCPYLVGFLVGAGEEKSQASGASVSRRSAGRSRRVMESGSQGGGSSAQPPLLGRRFGLGSGVIVNALGLEKDGVLRVSPKVSHRVAAMASAGDDLQSAVASTIRTRFTFLIQTQNVNTTRE